MSEIPMYPDACPHGESMGADYCAFCLRSQLIGVRTQLAMVFATDISMKKQVEALKAKLAELEFAAEAMRNACWVVVPERAEYAKDITHFMCVHCEDGRPEHDKDCPFNKRVSK